MLRRLLVTWVQLRRSFAAQPRVEHSWTTVVETMYEEMPPPEKVDDSLEMWESPLVIPETRRVPGAGPFSSGLLVCDEHKQLNMTAGSRRYKSLKSQQKTSEAAAEYFMDRLELSRQEFYELAKHNVKIRQWKDLKKVDEKLEILKTAGVDLEDIRNYSQVLTNVGASTLKKRISEMQQVGYQQPLPAKVLAATKSRFMAMLEKFARGCSQHHEETTKREFLEKVKEKKVRMSYPGRNLSMLKLKQKIDFLESKGYSFEDIISHQVIGLTVPKMEETLENLQSYGIEDISLSMLFLFARYKRINSVHKSSLAPIAWILGVDEKVLHGTVPPNLRKYFTLQRTATHVENFKLLTKHGFSNDAIQKVCIVLCHHPQVLETQLSALKDRDELTEMPGVLDDEVKLLNTLQFFIERTGHFRQPVLLSVHEADSEWSGDWHTSEQEESEQFSSEQEESEQFESSQEEEDKDV